MKVLLGVDGGGSKTVAAVAALDGTVLATARGGASNYQSVGEEAAARALSDAIDKALSKAGATRAELGATALGLAGYDGPEEARIVARVVERALSSPSFLENDSLLILRAGTEDGVGVGVVAGTGNNCIARARDGRRLQIGGMGRVSGDAGSAPELAIEAVAAAWRSSDGRAPASALVPGICRALGIDALARAADRLVEGSFEDADVRAIVRALFEAAGEGDELSLSVVERAAEVLAGNARAALRGLALTGRDATVVLGGSVLEHYRLLRELVGRRLPEARVVRVPGPPVAGALLWAHDALHPAASARAPFKARVLGSLAV